ncbi:hypothetical protein ACODM8_16050 [Vibrio ostreicida]|uniref:hypothetical protein n=1 Tax=Vibrio ostreicida TaxID=526588 RepID=UPI003B5AA427
MWNIAKGCLIVTGAVLGLTDDEEVPQHTSQDDGVSNTTYTDGHGNHFKRDLTGDVRDPWGNSPD